MSMQGDYRLALDINTSAIGLVTYSLNEDNQADNLEHIDVHVFGEPVVGAKGTLKKALRREKRLQRRQVKRRAQRLKKIAHLFTLVGTTSEKVREVQEKQCNGSVHKWRADAVTQKITIEQLMAVFLLMAKNRGYEGRFTKAEDGKVASYIEAVKESMEEGDTLGQLLYKEQTNAQIKHSPWKKLSETGTYAHRDMLQDEFSKIWEEQEKHHTILGPIVEQTGECNKKVHEKIQHVYRHYFEDNKSIIPKKKSVSLQDLFYKALFDQRPIWWDKATIGVCELMPPYRRASRAHPVFQEYRIEQLLNNLELKRAQRKLSKEEKEKIREVFEKQKEVSAKRLYTELDIKNDRFTHDRSTELGTDGHKFDGNKTRCVLSDLEKKVDMPLDEGERELFIEIIADIDEPSFFGYEQWETYEEVRTYFSDGYTQENHENVIAFINKLYEKEELKTLRAMKLDTGRASYSVEALRKLVPHMKEGIALEKVLDREYPQWREKQGDNLKRVGDSVVQQALEETKKAINYAIKKHGGRLPAQVVIELSRDMKRSQEKRKTFEKEQKDKQNAQAKARKELEDMGQNPNDHLCKKYILWTEQKKQCVYCTKNLSIADIVNSAEIDHIVPQAYGGQGNHANLAVVHKACNQTKSDNLPLEAFGDDASIQSHIKTMSEAMKNPTYLTTPFDAYKEDVKKRAHILMKKNNDDLEEGFKLRQNHETAWIGRELTAYLKQRFNINTTDKGTLEDRVYITKGALTAYLRKVCGLNTLIADIRKEEGKPVFNVKGEIMQCGSWKDGCKNYEERYDKRSDHRHHAVDAAVIGLVDRSMFAKATKYYQEQEKSEYHKKKSRLKGFENNILLHKDLHRMLKQRLQNYVVWHKPDKMPIDGFFDEQISRCKSIQLKDEEKPSESAADTDDKLKLIRRKKLSELVAKTKTKTYEATKKNLEDLIVEKHVKDHIIKEFEMRYKNSQELSESKDEKARCKYALCGTDTDDDDGIFYPPNTKNKVKCLRVYHKDSRGVGRYNADYDKCITVRDAWNNEHTHVLKNKGYACFEIKQDNTEDPKYKPIPYHVYWAKSYQTILKGNDAVVRIYKNDIIYDRESKEYYVVKKFTALPPNQKKLHCIKTTETVTYGKAREKAKDLIHDFGEKKIKNIQLIKSRKDIVDSINTHEPSPDCST